MTGWQRDAQCRGYDPRWWDCETYHRRPRRGGAPATQIEELRRRIAMASLCQGCPVAAECAADVAEHPGLMVGIIRAGVSGASPRPPHPRSSCRRHLRRVADGMTPVDAVIADLTGPVPAEVIPTVVRALARGRVPYLVAEGVGA